MQTNSVKALKNRTAIFREFHSLTEGVSDKRLYTKMWLAYMAQTVEDR